ncbi:hypothetical protein HMPREF0083_01256 [Aneurinibacillus aneurinilyticus ATCC 12856]|uniref:Uncharacterized protein n=1 Tax=Aneurinibacillus aneurinilyticus ATCC 12856 TaxID=649747 RepID=U1X7X7_ANEAE|nr:hypothetical protein HMPREF0083_01256 [Aneurinibacillus aneurinilyticus ATCC 12856]
MQPFGSRQCVRWEVYCLGIELGMGGRGCAHSGSRRLAISDGHCGAIRLHSSPY